MIHNKITYGGTAWTSTMVIFWAVVIYLIWVNWQDSEKLRKKLKK